MANVFDNGPYPSSQSMLKTLANAQGVGIKKMRKIKKAMYLFSFEGVNDAPHRFVANVGYAQVAPPPYRPSPKKGRPKKTTTSHLDSSESELATNTGASGAAAAATAAELIAPVLPATAQAAQTSAAPNGDQQFTPTEDSIKARL